MLLCVLQKRKSTRLQTLTLLVVSLFIAVGLFKGVFVCCVALVVLYNYYTLFVYILYIFCIIMTFSRRIFVFLFVVVCLHHQVAAGMLSLCSAVHLVECLLLC